MTPSRELEVSETSGAAEPPEVPCPEEPVGCCFENSKSSNLPPEDPEATEPTLFERMVEDPPAGLKFCCCCFAALAARYVFLSMTEPLPRSGDGARSRPPPDVQSVMLELWPCDAAD